MFAVEILRLQPPAQPIFKTPYAKTTGPVLHARGFPYTRPDGVDFRVFANLCRYAFAVWIGGERLFHFNPSRNTGRGVEAAIDAHPTLRCVTT